jgi:hypothetical protein
MDETDDTAGGLARMRVITATLMTVSSLLTACSTTAQETPIAQTNPAAESLCRPELAVKLVGHAAPDDARIRKDTGAELIRRIVPGGAVTHDFRGNRITLAIDPAGNVVQANCG